MRRQYYGLDVIKLLAAVAVVAAHTEPLRHWDNGPGQTICHFVITMAVPYFFIVSGYLLFAKLDEDLYTQRNTELLKKALLRTLRLYLAWHAVYLPVSIYGAVTSGKPFLIAAARFAVNLLFMGEQYCSWQLWYLLSSVYGLAFLYFAVKRKWKMWQILMGTAVYWLMTYGCMVVLADLEDYSGIQLLVGTAINEAFLDGRVFTGLGYLTIGMISARYKLRLNLPAGITITAAGMLLGLQNLVPIAIGVMISAFGLFVIGLQFSSETPHPIFQRFREASTVIYFTHMLLFFVGQLIFGDLLGLEYYGPMSFVWSLATSLLLSAAVHKLGHVRIVRFLFR